MEIEGELSYEQSGKQITRNRKCWDRRRKDFERGLGLSEQGEKDTSDGALKVKMGVAWGIVRFDELKENVVNYFNKEKEQKKDGQ